MTFYKRSRYKSGPTNPKKVIIFLALLLLLSLIFVTVSNAQRPPPMDFGKQEFEARCATCHGKDGKGYGWLADFLIDGPTDLTRLSKNNGGVLPISRIYQSLWEGTIPIHGKSNMPIWGPEYQYEAYQIYPGDPYFGDIYTESRILLLLEYISRLQAK